MNNSKDQQRRKLIEECEKLENNIGWVLIGMKQKGQWSENMVKSYIRLQKELREVANMLKDNGKYLDFSNKRMTMAMRSKLIVNDKMINTVIDTGAATSIITVRLMEELGLRIESKSEFKYTMADGSKEKSLGKTTVGIDLNERIKIPVRVEVIESEGSELILGNDTLRKIKARIDYKKKVIGVGKYSQIPMEYERIYY
jgi:predicted aspartyl protease